jgi:hypothetical protein
MQTLKQINVQTPAYFLYLLLNFICWHQVKLILKKQYVIIQLPVYAYV